MHGQTPALAGDVDVNKSRPAKSSRLITIGCLQMGKARSSGNLHLSSFRPIPAFTNLQHGARPKKAILDYLSAGKQPPTAALNLHCAAPQAYCKFFGNGFSVAPVNELYDTDASVMCVQADPPGLGRSVLPDSTCEEYPVVLSLQIPENQQTRAQAHRYCSGHSCHNCKDAACSATLACTVCNVPWPFSPVFRSHLRFPHKRARNPNSP